MIFSDYMETTQNGWDGVGILNHKIYVYTRKTKPLLNTEFREIQKNEYETFDIWKDDQSILHDLLQRPICYIGYWRNSELRKINKK